jgi:hypothetical protein
MKSIETVYQLITVCLLRIHYSVAFLVASAQR